MKITVRDGQRLDVYECLTHTREAIDGWAASNHSPENPVHGMALALEAALLRVIELGSELDDERARSRRRRWLG